MRSVAINVAANTNEPGFRGPCYPDGGFEYVPIPESKPTADPVPTYADLDLATDVSGVADWPVHFDPEFPEAGGERYTYGDEHGVKAGPLSELSAGDYLFFYATLSTTDEVPDWAPPSWGAFVVGHFRLARDAVTGEQYRSMADDDRAVFASNAHVKRAEFDARVLVLGDPDESRLYETVVPLSESTGGTDANWLVTERSSDSGKGPWWRRPMRFDESGTETLLDLADRDPGAVER
ncbi:hypothetical protein [Haloarcula pellucida]|uniref:Nucleotide modification associated domain-containing protein n=1 Tax=Haloarcula pellucida TaxID=1427151 RepID=A0A830GNU4_9EURY|nr:hypothetical protein [Halomicroarcula pellucida]MBX0349229.1 hypothetical protein [Halomicroarcula pellucida]GGN99607.1 hypothetical protein GCM10009030_31360 [Halomicroarcula pellucida]